jgi:DNA modification methylase
VSFEGINIFNCDCMDLMRDMADKSIDLAIVDPPYGNVGGDVEWRGGKAGGGYLRQAKLLK